MLFSCFLYNDFKASIFDIVILDNDFK